MFRRRSGPSSPAARPTFLLFVLSVALGGCGRQGTGPGPEGLEAQRPSEEAVPPRFQEALLAASLPGWVEGVGERLSQGLALMAAGDTLGAVEAFRAVADSAPAMADWALAIAAELLAVSGRPSEVDEAVSGLPADLRDRWGWRPTARVAIRSGEPEMAKQLLARVLPRLDAAVDSAEAFRLLAETELARGESGRARRYFRLSMWASPRSRAAGASAVRLGGLGMRGAEDHRALVRFHLARGELAQAGRALERYARLPDTDVSARTALRLEYAAALLARGRTAEGEKLLAALAASTTDPSLQARAHLLMGRARLGRGRTADARQALEKAAERSGTPAAQEALFILADLDQDAGRIPLARARFRAAMEQFPDTEWAADAAVRLGTLAFLEGDVLEATRVFEGYRDFHPGGWRFQQATYWKGLSLRVMGRDSLARALFEETAAADPVSFYGVRAAEEAGLPPLRDRLPPGPQADSLGNRLAEGGLARLRLLEALGLPEHAAVESARLRANLARRPDGLHALGEALHKEGRLLEAVRLGREIRRTRGHWDARSLRIVFPLPFREEILTAADRHGVDPFLMAGLIRQESLFDPGAVSSAGAVGLMQLLPRTARDLASRHGLGSVDERALRNVEVNVSLGALHLRELLGRHGRADDVLVEYNAGAGRLARWRAHPEYRIPEVFVERIPFRETRDYVRTVTENARIYEALYGSDSPTLPGRVAGGATVEAGATGTASTPAPATR